MKSAILCFPYITSRKPQYPTGIYRIADYCKNSYQIYVLDERVVKNLYTEIDNILSDQNVLCLGLSVMTGEQILSALKISKKYHGKIPIVWGGMHPTILPELTIKNNYVDYVVIGEGESSFLGLLKYLDDNNSYQPFLSKINHNYSYNIFNNFSTHDYINNDAQISECYFINRDEISRGFPIETSRGCPFKCKFCHNSIDSVKYRAMAENTFDTVIDVLHYEYNINGVILQEDNFFKDQERATRAISYLKEKALSLKANCRFDQLKMIVNLPNIVELLTSIEHVTLQIGIETGTSRLQKMIGKKIDIAELIKLNKRLEQYNINLRYNFIIGFPTETTKEISDTLSLASRLLNENKNVKNPFINIYTPYPKTKLYELAKRSGFIEPKTLEEWANVTWNTANKSMFSQEMRYFLTDVSKKYFEQSTYLRD